MFPAIIMKTKITIALFALSVFVGVWVHNTELSTAQTGLLHNQRVMPQAQTADSDETPSQSDTQTTLVSTSEQLRNMLIKRLQEQITKKIQEILESLVNYYKSIETLDRDLVAIAFSDNDQEPLTVLVVDSQGVRWDYVPPSQNPKIAINILAIEYGISREEVRAKIVTL